MEEKLSCFEAGLPITNIEIAPQIPEGPVGDKGKEAVAEFSIANNLLMDSVT